MSGLQKALLEDQRLVILRMLNEAPDRAANESVIQSSLDIWGHRLSRDVISGIVDWLAEAGLVRVEAVSADIRVATLTGRGQDVAEGRSKYTGVKRPRANGGAGA